MWIMPFLNLPFLDQIAVSIEKTKGDTADDTVNELHIDLVKLTAIQIYNLAKLIQENGELERIPKKKIKAALIEGLSNGNLNKSKMNPNLVKKIENL